ARSASDGFSRRWRFGLVNLLHHAPPRGRKMNKYRQQGKMERPTASCADVLTIHVPLYTLEQPRQNTLRTNLIEAFATGRQKVAHRLFPENRLRHLPP